MARYVLSDTGPVQQILHTDAADETRGAIEVVQDVDAALKAARMARDRGFNPKATFRPMAEIPMADWLEACRLGKEQDQKYWRDWLNDPAHRNLRIAPGRV